MGEIGNYHFGSIIDGRELSKEGRIEVDVLNPYTSEVIGKIVCALPNDAADAVSGAHRMYAKTMKKIPSHKRAEILSETAALLEDEAESFAHLLSMEAGKIIKESRADVACAVQVLRFAAEGANSIYGQMMAPGHAMAKENQLGLSKRVSLGVVVAIVSFNLPLHLLLHQIAAAIAAGNTIVLNPSQETPLASVLLYRLFEKAGLPRGAIHIVMGTEQELAEALVTHPKVKRVIFTGSRIGGWEISGMAKPKKVTLELKSTIPNIVFEDADLEVAINAIINGAFTYAGQALAVVQQIYVQAAVYTEFLEKLTEKVKRLQLGDPLDETTDLGPLITEEAAQRAQAWITEAIDQGAALSAGGNRRGTLMEATIVSGATPDMKVVYEEVSAPIVSVMPFTVEKEAVKGINDSGFFLQAWIFTANINRARRIADALKTEEVWINEGAASQYGSLLDNQLKIMGIRQKERVMQAIKEMTDVKFIGSKF